MDFGIAHYYFRMEDTEIKAKPATMISTKLNFDSFLLFVIRFPSFSAITNNIWKQCEMACSIEYDLVIKSTTPIKYKRDGRCANKKWEILAEEL